MSPVFRKKRSRSLNSPRLILFKQIFIGLCCFLLLGLFGYGVWYISHLTSLNIDTIEVSGGQTIKHDEVRSTAMSFLVGSYYKLVPRSFMWTYPKAGLTEAIDNLPRVKSVTVDEIGGNTLQIQVEEYLPYALWCDAYTDTCLFIDIDGYAFAVAPPLSGSAFWRYKDSDRAPELNKILTEQQVLRNTALLAKKFETDFGLAVNYIEIEKQKTINYYLIGGGSLKTLFNQEPEELLENLAAILNSDEFSHLQTGNFQYIDLRFGDKVFINEELMTEETEEIEEEEAEGSTEEITGE